MPIAITPPPSGTPGDYAGDPEAYDAARKAWYLWFQTVCPELQAYPETLAALSGVMLNVNPSYTGTLTGGTGVINIGGGQIYKDAAGQVGFGTAAPSNKVEVRGTAGVTGTFYAVGSASAPAGTIHLLGVLGITNGYSVTKDGVNNVTHIWENQSGEAMRIVSDKTVRMHGSVGIGPDSPSAYSLGPSLLVSAATSGSVMVKSATTGYGGVFFADGTTGDEQYRGFIQYNHNYLGDVDQLLFGTAGTVKVRLDSSGNLLAGTTGGAMHTLQKTNPGDYAAKVVNASGSFPYGLAINYTGVTGGTGASFIACNDDATRFMVLGNGNAQNINNSYGAISDLKLKENITDVSPKLAKLLKVRIVNYSLKSDPDKTKLIGVIAQELEQISPGLIEETPDFEEVTRTREVPKTVAVTEKTQVKREQKTVEVVGGKAIVKTAWVEELADVPVLDHFPLFDEAGQPVLEVDTPEVPAVTDDDGNVTQPSVPATYRQALHSVPRMHEVTETEAYTERVPLGTVTKSVKYSIFVPMLIKAMQEQQAQIDALTARLEALESKA